MYFLFRMRKYPVAIIRYPFCDLCLTIECLCRMTAAPKSDITWHDMTWHDIVAGFDTQVCHRSSDFLHYQNTYFEAYWSSNMIIQFLEWSSSNWRAHGKATTLQRSVRAGLMTPRMNTKQPILSGRHGRFCFKGVQLMDEKETPYFRSRSVFLDVACSFNRSLDSTQIDRLNNGSKLQSIDMQIL